MDSNNCITICFAGGQWINHSTGEHIAKSATGLVKFINEARLFVRNEKSVEPAYSCKFWYNAEKTMIKLSYDRTMFVKKLVVENIGSFDDGRGYVEISHPDFNLSIDFVKTIIPELYWLDSGIDVKHSLIHGRLHGTKLSVRLYVANREDLVIAIKDTLGRLK